MLNVGQAWRACWPTAVPVFPWPCVHFIATLDASLILAAFLNKLKHGKVITMGFYHQCLYHYTSKDLGGITHKTKMLYTGLHHQLVNIGRSKIGTLPCVTLSKLLQPRKVRMLASTFPAVNYLTATHKGRAECFSETKIFTYYHFPCEWSSSSDLIESWWHSNHTP